MYAFVREADGKFYMSKVFGYFDCRKDKIDYYHRYWIVLNREKNALIKQSVFLENTKYLETMVLVVDSDQRDWISLDEKRKAESFLPADELLDMIESNTVPDELLRRCIDEDQSYMFNEYPEVCTEKDVEDLMWVSGSFHDAYIADLRKDGESLYVLFEGTWGCKIEIWFSGEVSYDVSSRDPDSYDPYWFGSTVILHDGFVYILDDDDATLDNIGDGWCWFKARKMKYHVIPLPIELK